MIKGRLFIVMSLAFAFAFAFACVSPEKKNVNVRSYSLSEVEKLSIGRMSQSDAILLFGESPFQVTNDKEGEVVWFYYFGDRPRHQRMNLTFDSHSKILTSVAWFVQETESEFDLSHALVRYSKGQFKKHTIQWQRADFISTRTTYTNNSRGISIDVNEGDNSKVSSIAWTTPGTITERDGFIDSPKSNGDWRIVIDRRVSPQLVSQQLNK